METDEIEPRRKQAMQICLPIDSFLALYGIYGIATGFVTNGTKLRRGKLRKSGGSGERLRRKFPQDWGTLHKLHDLPECFPVQQL